MKAFSKICVNLAFGVAGALVVFLAMQGFSVAESKEALAPPKLNLQTAPINRDTKVATTSFAPVIKQVAPSVVYVYTTKTVKENPRADFGPLFMDPFFRQFFDADPRYNRRPREHQENGLGSGVIVSEDGYILTNNHVVDGADEVKVALAKSKEEYTAKVIGTDPATDIAVLKIDAKGLPAVTMTDSDNLEVGDIVLAIGNPFGVGQTVTMGIVSATSRGGFGIVDYENFIQTDASINPGNSGGALVDATGRLVGINTAIISRSGGNQGIGFAVPANMARLVMERIIKDGKVVRGFLGVNIQPVTADLAKAFNVPTQNGALVAGVSPNTPAAKAGLADGDVIVEFNGKKVEDSRHLRLMVSQTPPDTKVNLKALRDGQPKSFTLTLGELPSERIAGQIPGKSWKSRDTDTLDGVTVADIDSQARRQHRIPTEVRGALVTDVDPGSPSYRAGLRAGDVIESINREDVQNADHAVRLSEKAIGRPALLKVWSPNLGGSRFLMVQPKSLNG
ncbi:MAG: DegQ family serine endoprotease [Verrucomicrobiota bacterium]